MIPTWISRPGTLIRAFCRFGLFILVSGRWSFAADNPWSSEMPTRYRLLCLALLVLVGAAAVEAAPATGTRSDLDRIATLRALTLLRPAPVPGSAPAVRAKLAEPAGDPGAIAGTLSGLDPEGFYSATVTVWSADSTADRSSTGMAMVQPDGQYRIEGLEPGEYYVSATAKGYLPQYYKGATVLSDAVTVTVNAGETAGSVDFALERMDAGSGSIAGVVRSDADGQGLAEVTVHAYSPDNPFIYGMAQTGRDGTYQMTGLYPGRYVLEVFANGYLPEYYRDAASPEEATQVEVVENGRVEGVDFGLAVGGSISGYVRHLDGTAVAGAWVQATFDWPREISTDSVVTAEGRSAPMRTDSWAVTDETGFYRIGGLATGNWIVQAQASTRWYYAYQWYPGVDKWEEAAPVAVTFGAETPGIDFGLNLPVMGSAISGRVTDREGNPLAEAWISVQSTATISRDKDDPAGSEGTVPSAVWVWAYASTDKEGNYVVGELPAGEYLIAASAQVGWEYVQRWYRDAATVEEAAPILLAEHQRAEGIDLALPVRVGTASLSGVVRDSNGAPLAWAFVEVTAVVSTTDPNRSGTFFAYAQTDSLGGYRVDRLPAGDYRVHASYGTGDRYGHGWYQGASTPDDATPVSLSDGASRADVDFSLVVRPLYGVVAGSVTDAATGAPLARAYVELAPVGRDVLLAAPFRWSVNHAITDDKGRFEMTWIPEGGYSLTVYANGGGTGSAGQAEGASFTVVGGETAIRDVALSLRYDGDGVISGTVTVDYGQTGPLYEPAVAPAADLDVAIAPDSRIAYPGNLEVAVVLAYPVSAGAAAAELPYTAVTAADGTYSLRGLAPGEYAVMCFAPGSIGTYYGGTYAPEKSELVNVDGTAPTTGIDFALAPVYYWRFAAADGAEGGIAAPTAGDKDASAAGNSSSAVYGKVTDESGNAVAGATVYLLDETEQPTAYSQTGPDGSFELTNVVPGGYRVYASKLGVGGAYNGNNQSFVAAEPLAVNGGYLEVNLVLSSGSSTAVEEEEGETLPQTFTLNRCYPNPFNPSTLIGFSVAASGPATLRVYNALGQEVAVLFNDRAEAGRAYELSFRAEALSAGTYIYTIESGGQRLSQAMTLVK